MSTEGLPEEGPAACRCGRGINNSRYLIKDCTHAVCPHKPAAASSANARQVGGSHYADGGELQHWDLIEIYGCGYLEGCATKYLTRWRKKNGVQDLEKSLHYTEKLQELFLKGKVRPRGLVPDDVMQKFLRLNKVDKEEGVIIDMLCSWSGQNLFPAIERLQALIARANAEVHEDNTGQKAPFGFEGDK